MQRRGSRQAGFTIVELLVSLALIMFIMAILSAAFGEAAKTFRALKSAGDQAERLRATSILLRRDLASWHFDDNRRLSDTNFWTSSGVPTPPPVGFFRIYQGSVPVADGVDLDAASPPNISIDHALQFSVRLGFGQNPVAPGDFFSAQVPVGFPLLSDSGASARYQLPAAAPWNNITYNYQWGEVAWFLARQQNPASGQFELTANGEAALYSLYRRQLVAVPPSAKPAGIPVANAGNYPDLSVQPARVGVNAFFNSEQDLPEPARRFGMDPTVPAAGAVTAQYAGRPNANRNTGAAGSAWEFPALYAPRGVDSLTGLGIPANSDLMLTDVLSFDIQVLVDGKTTFLPLSQLQQYANNNPAYPAATGPWVFDTWSGIGTDLEYPSYSTWQTGGTFASIPLFQNTVVGATPTYIRIRAIQITLRIWDSKTQLARQVTIIQDM